MASPPKTGHVPRPEAFFEDCQQAFDIVVHACVHTQDPRRYEFTTPALLWDIAAHCSSSFANGGALGAPRGIWLLDVGFHYFVLAKQHTAAPTGAQLVHQTRG
jgi:hypothetical protein